MPRKAKTEETVVTEESAILENAPSVMTISQSPSAGKNAGCSSAHSGGGPAGEASAGAGFTEETVVTEESAILENAPAETGTFMEGDSPAEGEILMDDGMFRGRTGGRSICWCRVLSGRLWFWFRFHQP